MVYIDVPAGDPIKLNKKWRSILEKRNQHYPPRVIKKSTFSSPFIFLIILKFLNNDLRIINATQQSLRKKEKRKKRKGDSRKIRNGKHQKKKKMNDKIES